MAEEKAKKTPIYKKWWFWVIIVVVILCVGAAAGNSDKDPKKVGESSESTSSSSGESESSTFKVGDVIAVEDQEMTITGVERNWTAEYMTPKDGKEYIRVSITLANKSDETISYYSSFWKLEDADGAIDDSAIVIGNDDNLSYGEIAAGGKKSGSLIFEVSKGETSLKVHYKPSFWTSREVIIAL